MAGRWNRVVGEAASIVFVLVALILYIVSFRRLWRKRSWVPRGLYLAGGVLLGASVLLRNPAWSAIGVIALMLSRIVPDREKAQPG